MKSSSINLALLLLRLGFGGFMLTHGIPKINYLFQSPIKFTNPLGIGDTATLLLTLIGEVVAPILIIIGFKTKWATIPAAITMGVAAFVVHAKDSLSTKERALLFFIAFVVIFLAGPGKYSIDDRK
ncbi:putative oxidoreductase [Flavobacteriaceae bacterium MAR_2010_72]|nr:putative oxidoreductase [Flavobacteriaceae bacterium MAR_2010_72]TVZ59956.1 putative oxidoreductase [Flavobacteriaceae bacterium MAR_2010_105]